MVTLLNDTDLCGKGHCNWKAQGYNKRRCVDCANEYNRSRYTTSSTPRRKAKAVMYTPGYAFTREEIMKMRGYDVA